MLGKLEVVIGYVLDVVYLSWLLQTLLIRMPPSQRSLEVKLSRILIFSACRVNANNGVLIKSLVVVSVTVVLGIVGRGHIRYCLRGHVVAIWVDRKVLNGLSVVRRQHLLDMAWNQRGSLRIRWRDVIHFESGYLWQVSDCLLVLLAVFCSRH